MVMQDWMLALLILGISGSLVQSETLCGFLPCVHGWCSSALDTEGQCVCEKGWTGKRCDMCGGRVKLIEDNGIIIDGKNSYIGNDRCAWILEGTANATLRLTLESLATECNFDQLHIYDGISTHAPLLAVYSGIQREGTLFPELISKSGSAYVVFTSDWKVHLSGFQLSYSFGGCLQNCSGHGECVNERCECQEGWRGSRCEEPQCVMDKYCGNNGECSQSGKCECQGGFYGDQCEAKVSEPGWRKVMPKGDLPPPQVLHQTVVVGNYIFLTSGYTWDSQIISNMTLYQFNFNTETWNLVTPSSAMNPSSRSSHSLCHYGDQLMMYGGEVNSDFTDELWNFNTVTNEWKQLESGPHKVMGHTAHIVGDIMYIIFGYSLKLETVSTVLQYNISDDQWATITTKGALVKGVYRHSSVYDKDTSKIFVYGGLRTKNIVSMNAMYSFDVNTKTWTVHPQGLNRAYLHSAANIDGFMFIYGGSKTDEINCHVSKLFAYDIKCDKWTSVTSNSIKNPGMLSGHSAEGYQGSMFVFGGFNGILENSLWVFNPGNCSHLQSSSECTSSKSALQCVWSDEKGCLSRYAAESMKLGDATNKECEEPEASPKMCPQATDCRSCVSTSPTFNCTWCGEACTDGKNCNKSQMIAETEEECLNQESSSFSDPCIVFLSCTSCTAMKNCSWRARSQSCHSLSSQDFDEDDYLQTCSPPCSQHASCNLCTAEESGCMWCSSTKQCVPEGDFNGIIPYGKCLQAASNNGECIATQCSEKKTCKECFQNPSCGWCSDPSNTGLGVCMEGGGLAPSSVTSFCHAERWFFSNCPICQCNGHSSCHPKTPFCKACQNHTKGSQCETCDVAYYGNPQNGGQCQECKEHCQGRADHCNPTDGSCFCNTYGVTGDDCSKCDYLNRFIGNASKEGCYYELLTNLQFPFTIKKEEHQAVQFFNLQLKPQVNSKFIYATIHCSGDFPMNITFREKGSSVEKSLFSNVSCRDFWHKFSPRDYDFTQGHETSFQVYIYNLQPPVTVTVSFQETSNEWLQKDGSTLRNPPGGATGMISSMTLALFHSLIVIFVTILRL